VLQEFSKFDGRRAGVVRLQVGLATQVGRKCSRA
jgi:hypothetical protein